MKVFYKFVNDVINLVFVAVFILFGGLLKMKDVAWVLFTSVSFAAIIYVYVGQINIYIFLPNQTKIAVYVVTTET